MTIEPRRLGVAELAAFAIGAADPAELLETPAVVVTPDGLGDIDADALARHIASLPCVLVGEPGGPAALAPLLDVQTDDATWLPTLDRVLATPQAAAGLALLLRSSERRSIDEGLVAESATYSLLQAGPEFAAWRATRSKPAERAPDGTVLIDRIDDVLVLTLDRPSRHNAYSRAMRDALAEGLRVAVADPTIRVVELRGSGPSFSSGGDLDEFGDRPDPATAHVTRLARSPARLLARLADRVVSHLHGSCLGAGIELPAFGARVLATPDASIGLPELSLGLVPGAGGTVSLPRRIGRLRTGLLAFSGVRLDAPTALTWGLVDEIVDRLPDPGTPTPTR